MRKRQESFLQGSDLYPSWLKAALWTGLGSSLLYSLLHADFVNQARLAEKELAGVAAARNTCEVQEIERFKSDAGDVALKLTVQVQPGSRPEAKKSQYNPLHIFGLSLGDITFRDGDEQLDSLQVVGGRDAATPEAYTTHNGPDGPTNTAVFTFDRDTMPPAGTSYSVLRRNTVVVHSELLGGIETRERSDRALIVCVDDGALARAIAMP